MKFVSHCLHKSLDVIESFSLLLGLDKQAVICFDRLPLLGIHEYVLHALTKGMQCFDSQFKIIL